MPECFVQDVAFRHVFNTIGGQPLVVDAVAVFDEFVIVRGAGQFIKLDFDTVVEVADDKRPPISTRERKPERIEFLADVIITAAEGGIGYWSQVSVYKWWDPDLEGGTAEHTEGQQNAYMVVHEQADGDQDDDLDPELKVAFIGVDDIARALGILRKGPVEGISDEARRLISGADRENDAGSLDAGDADSIVQVAMFGKVVYG